MPTEPANSKQETDSAVPGGTLETAPQRDYPSAADIAKILLAYWLVMGEDAIRKLAASGWTRGVALASWVPTLTMAVAPAIYRHAKIGYDRERALIGKLPIPKPQANVATLSGLATVIDFNTRQLLDGVVRTTEKRVNVVLNGYHSEVANGLRKPDLSDLALRVRGIFRDRKRARWIADDAAADALHRGSLAAAREVVTLAVTKTWRVKPGCCDLCLELDGETVGINERFYIRGVTVDGPILHPRCRCTLSFGFKEVGIIPPQPSEPPRLFIQADVLANDKHIGRFVKPVGA